MCGRLTQRYTWAELNALLDLIESPRNLRPPHNIAPTTSIDVVRAGDAGRELAQMRWGLIPAWWKKCQRRSENTSARRSKITSRMAAARLPYAAPCCASVIRPWGSPVSWLPRPRACAACPV
jgi:putative SOS response-associated peptidase YedK